MLNVRCIRKPLSHTTCRPLSGFKVSKAEQLMSFSKRRRLSLLGTPSCVSGLCTSHVLSVCVHMGVYFPPQRLQLGEAADLTDSRLEHPPRTHLLSFHSPLLLFCPSPLLLLLPPSLQLLQTPLLFLFPPALLTFLLPSRLALSPLLLGEQRWSQQGSSAVISQQ